MTALSKFRDLGLGYPEALHGVQSAIKYELSRTHPDMPEDIAQLLKHMRVGIDAQKAEFGAFIALLIDKGLVTEAEIWHTFRLGMNEELARYTDHCREKYGLPNNIDFR